MNEYQLGYALGGVFGVLLVLGILLFLLRFSKKDHGLKCKFDERQLQKRGTAFKLGFFTLLIENVLHACVSPLITAEDSWLPFRFEDGTGGIFLQICIAVGVFAGYSIWNDCYFSLNESRSRLLILFSIAGGCNLILFLLRFAEGALIENGVLSVYWNHLFCGLLFLFIFLMLLLRRLRPEDMED